MILHHGSSKTMPNGLALPDLSLRRTSLDQQQQKH
jgi:hypothetical protein